MSNLMLPGFGPPLPKDMQSLHQDAMNCMRCRLHETRSQVVWGQGNVDSPLILIGQGPSVTDDRSGSVYSGPAGDELNSLLQQVGVTRNQVYISNVHKCLARDKNDPYNIRQPTKTELTACREWLDSELYLLKAKWVVCIGSISAKWLIGEGFDLTTQHGQWFSGVSGKQFMGIYQPTYITRLRQHAPDKASQAETELLQDLRKAALVSGLISEVS